jgi:hypothetical protein
MRLLRRTINPGLIEVTAALSDRIRLQSYRKNRDIPDLRAGAWGKK